MRATGGLIRFKSGWAPVLLVAGYWLVSLQTASAESGGINGYSGQSGSTCTSCHNNTGALWSASPVIQDIDGSLIGTDPNNSSIFLVVPGSTGNSFRVNATSANSVGVGLDLSVNGGALVDQTDRGHIENGELTHDSPQTPANAFWDFDYNAPATVGTYTFYWCNNLVDLNGLEFRSSGAGGNRDHPVCQTRQVKVNTSPNANNDTFNSVNEDSTGNCLSVLTNDTSGSGGNETGDSISLFSLGTPSQGGTVTPGNGITCATGQVRYTPAGDFDGTETFTYTIRDSFNQSGFADTATATVNLVGQNDVPTVTGFAGTLAYNENDAATIVDNAITLADIDDTTFNRAEIEISTNCVLAEDRLEVSSTICSANSLTCTQSDNCSLVISSAGHAIANYDTVLQAVTYRNVSENPNTGSRTVRLRVRDTNNGYSTPYATKTITVAADNDDPVIAEGASTGVAMSEDNSPTPFSLTLNAADVDSGTLTWSIPSQGSNGTASASGTGASKSIGYTPTLNYSGADSFVVRVSDGSGGFDDITVNVTISAVNDIPTVTGFAGTSVFTEGGSAVGVDSDITLGDVDDTDINRAEMAISTNCGLLEDILEFGAACPGGLTCAQVDACTLTVSGTAPLAIYETLLESVTYNNTSGNPDTGDRTVRLRVRDDSSNAFSNYSTKTVSVTAFSDPPTINGVDGTLNYAENNPATTVDGTITLGDVDSSNLNRAEAEISTNCALAEDRLEVSAAVCSANSITCTQSDNCTLALTGIQPFSSYEAVLEAVTYRNVSDNPSAALRTVRMRVRDDSSNFSAYDDKSIAVAADNDAPVIAEGASTGVAMSEDGSPTPFSLTLNAADVDSGTLTWSVQSQGSNGTASASGTGASKAIGYTPTLNYNGADSFVVRVSDGSGGIDDITVNVIVSAVNDPPVIVEGVSIAVAMSEDGSPTPFSLTLNAADVDSGTLTWSILSQGSNGTASASGTGASKVIGYAPTLNYNGADSFVVRVSDGGLSDSITVNVTISAVNDPPAANNDTYSVPVNSSDNEFDVLANDTDIDAGDALSLISVGTPSSGGTVVIGAPCSANTLCYTPPADFIDVNTFTYVMQDSGGLQDTATVTVGGTDTDGDGVIDFLDNCPNDANAAQEDNDSDDEGDVCDDDDDNDGMPDTFENTHGLDPFDAADADQDLDGDGRTNLEEYQQGSDPTIDDVEPDFSGVKNITVNAIAYLTPVNLGRIKALDGADGAVTIVIESVTDPATSTVLPCNPLPLDTDPNYAMAVQICNEVRNSLFRPGRTVVTRTASDASGNTATVSQTVRVRPLANLLPNQVAVEGGVARIGVSLNGYASKYPVTFDYAVSGTAGSTDHDAVDGSLSVNAGTGGEIVVNLADDGITEGSETLVITLSNPKNAVLGNKSSHTVVINEGNIAPMVTLNVAQAANTGPLITRDAGTVTMTATVADLNAGDTFTYDWSQLHDFLIALNGTGGSGGNTFEFDTMGLDAGVYDMVVGVTDSGSPAATTSTRVMLNLKDSPPALGATDSDGDGVNDDVEGYQDADGNGIVDYLDPFNSVSGTNLIPNQTGQLQKTLLLQTDAGLKLRLGEVGLNAGAAGALVSQQNIATYANRSGGAARLPVDTFRNVGGIFDFEVYGLPVGESANIVLPLSSGILLDAVYRKFTLESGWYTFIDNANNGILSARSVQGICPAPGHKSYAPGLSIFNTCVQLTIRDGGPNDADGEANGVIRDPGGAAVADVTPEHEPPPAPDDGSSGGGAVHPLIVLCLIVWMVMVLRRRDGVR